MIKNRFKTDIQFKDIWQTVIDTLKWYTPKNERGYIAIKDISLLMTDTKTDFPFSKLWFSVSTRIIMYWHINNKIQTQLYFKTKTDFENYKKSSELLLYLELYNKIYNEKITSATFFNFSKPYDYKYSINVWKLFITDMNTKKYIGEIDFIWEKPEKIIDYLINFNKNV